MDVIQTKHWYWRWWGILLIILFVIAVAGIAFVGALIFDSVREIKGGRGQALQNKIYAGFTPSTVNTAFGSMTAPERSDLERTDSPYLGNSAAPVVIVEFLDFKCPNCETAAPIMRQVLEKYGSKVKLIVRHFPVETTHPGATRFSEIAYCAQQQGRFWPVLNYFFDHQADWQGAAVKEFVKWETVYHQLLV
jgi:protein-disulfide isomerase